jgi:hypothetical protein
MHGGDMTDPDRVTIAAWSEQRRNHAASAAEVADPLRTPLWTPWERRVSLALHAVVPLTTALWALGSAFTVWRDTFGSPWIALATVLVIEALGVFGLLLTVLDLTASRFWRALRHLLPLTPAPALGYTIHDLISRSAVWVPDLAVRLQIEPDRVAWAGTVVVTGLVTIVGWGSWHALEAELVDPTRQRMRSVTRAAERRRRALEAQHLAWLKEAELRQLALKLEMQRLMVAGPLAIAEAEAAHRLAEEHRRRTSDVQRVLQAWSGTDGAAWSPPGEALAAGAVRSGEALAAGAVRSGEALAAGAVRSGEALAAGAVRSGEARRRHAAVDDDHAGASGGADDSEERVDDRADEGEGAADPPAAVLYAALLVWSGVSQREAALRSGVPRHRIQRLIARAGGAASLATQYLGDADLVASMRQRLAPDDYARLRDLPDGVRQVIGANPEGRLEPVAPSLAVWS